MHDLTTRQQEVLDYIREHVAENGLPPTRAEIASAFGFRSVNAAEVHVKALARKGAIELKPDASRGIRLAEGVGLPLVGRVAAGNPILSEQHIEARYQMDPNLFRPRADYFLRVRGQSMKDAGIMDGDLLAVHRTDAVRSGQIVVARVGDEVTVKRFRRRGNQVQLLPENPDYQPIQLDLKTDPLAIEGLVVGLVRNGKPL